MKKQDEALFELIKSMSKSERAYYVKYSTSLPGKSGDKRHLQLFRALADMKIFDEKKLEKKLKAIHFPEHVHRVRLYLNNSILNCLDQYHREYNTSSKIFNLIKQAGILSNRKLYNHSNALLDKAEKIVKTNCKYHLEYEILQWRLLNHISLYHHTDWTIPEKIVDQMSVSSHMHYQVTETYRAYSVLTWLHEQKGGAQNKEEENYYKAKFKLLTRNIDEKSLEDYGQINLLLAKHTLGMLTNDTELVISSLEKNLDILKRNIPYFNSLKTFSAVCFNLFSFYIETKKFDKAEKEITKLETWLLSNKEQLNEDNFEDTFGVVGIQRLNLLVKDHTRTGNAKLAEKALAHFAKKNSLPNRFIIAYNIFMSQYYAYTNQPKQALKYVNDFLNTKAFKDHTIENYNEMELLNVFMHAKLEHAELTDSLVTSLKRKVKENARTPYSGLIEIIAKHFSHYFESNTASQQKQWRSDLIADLKKYYSKHPKQCEALEIDYVWYFEEGF